jgi:hypothetical protein
MVGSAHSEGDSFNHVDNAVESSQVSTRQFKMQNAKCKKCKPRDAAADDVWHSPFCILHFKFDVCA